MRVDGEMGEGGQVYYDDDGQVGDAEHEPHVDILEVGGAGERITRLRVEGDEHQQRRQAHCASLIKGLHGQQQRAIPVIRIGRC